LLLLYALWTCTVGNRHPRERCERVAALQARLNDDLGFALRNRPSRYIEALGVGRGVRPLLEGRVRLRLCLGLTELLARLRHYGGITRVLLRRYRGLLVVLSEVIGLLMPILLLFRTTRTGERVVSPMLCILLELLFLVLFPVVPVDEIPAGDYLKAAEDHGVYLSPWGRRQANVGAADTRGRSSVSHATVLFLLEQGKRGGMTEAIMSNNVLRLYCQTIGAELLAAAFSAWWRSLIAQERTCPIDTARLPGHSS